MSKFRYGFLFYCSSTFFYASNRAISSTVFSLFHHYLCSIPSNSSFLSTITKGSISFSQYLRQNPNFRLLSSSCVHFGVETSVNLIRNEASDVNITSLIVDIIESNGIYMEPNLNSFVSKLSKSDIIEILLKLNFLNVPALRFFTWLKISHPIYCRNADICSLVFANCGLLGDYEAMITLLKEFRDKQTCLSEKAFGFLPVSSTDIDFAKKSIDEIVGLLNVIGGSCCKSGKHSLVKFLCSSNSIDLARYVIQISENKVSYYCIVVKHMCSRNQFEEAQKLVDEMWNIECYPDSKIYNQLISYLCIQGRINEAFSLLEEMFNRGCSPDILTFEILIHFSCRFGCLDRADMLYNRMISIGIKPQLSTHYAYIRGCFRSQRFEEAYRYVKITSVKDRCVEQDVYNLLANLYVKNGDFVVARNIMAEMLGKGFKPKHSMFVRVTKLLYQSGETHFAERLKTLYEKLNES